MPRHKRKAIPNLVKIEACRLRAAVYEWYLPPDLLITEKVKAALRCLGFYDPSLIQWDHDPPLELRPDNADGTDYEPAQLDPRHIFPMLAIDHKAKTTGRKGESKLSISGNGDKSRIDKVKRIRAKREATSPELDRALKTLLSPYDRAMTEIMRWPKESKRLAEPPPKPKRPTVKRSWPARKLESRGFEKKSK